MYKDVDTDVNSIDTDVGQDTHKQEEERGLQYVLLRGVVWHVPPRCIEFGSRRLSS